MFREDDMKLKVRSKNINQEPVFEVLKCKWTILILANIIEGLSRPSQLKRAIPGITAKVLSERLKRLERSGIVKRKSFSGYPLHVEYLLDLGGKKLIRTVSELRKTTIQIDFITEVISCKWMLEILDALTQTALRSNQLKRHLAGISGKILSERLRKLERMGFVSRDIIDIMPPGVNYSLTERGKRLINFLMSSRKFAF